MSKDSRQSIRNDNLRLILSSHEAGFIDSGLVEAHVGLRQILKIGGFAVCAVIVLVCLRVYGELPAVVNTFIVIAAVFPVVTLLVCSVNALGAYFSLRRFRSYRNDHDKFLKHYRRET